MAGPGCGACRGAWARSFWAAGGLALGLGLLAWWTNDNSVWAQRGPVGALPTGELMAIPLASANGGNWIALVEPGQRRMAVYEITGAGQITLKSVRNLTWDLALEEFNVGAPAPNEIRKLLPQ